MDERKMRDKFRQCKMSRRIRWKIIYNIKSVIYLHIFIHIMHFTDNYSMRVCSDRQRRTYWTPRDDIQSQRKDAIKPNMILLQATFITLKILKFSGDNVWRWARQSISAEILLTSLTSWRHKRCWNLLNVRWIRRGGQNNYCWVWISFNFIHHRIMLWTRTQCPYVFQHFWDDDQIGHS